MNEKFLEVGDVMQILGISRSAAYKLMRQINSELEKKGYIVIRGKVSRKYFEERIYDMIDTQKLKGLIAERNTSQRQVAFALGMTEKTFYEKMKIGIFGSDEIDKMIELLEIQDPMPIFFAQLVTLKVTKD